MIIDKPRVTVEAFEAFIYHPDNVDRDFELIGGEIYEVVANGKSSKIAVTISTGRGVRAGAARADHRHRRHAERRRSAARFHAARARDFSKVSTTGLTYERCITLLVSV